MGIIRFQHTVLRWYQKNRRDMPWRRTTDPYKILVSEVMLQQTQVSRVLPKYEEFLATFPTLKALAKTSHEELFRAWKGLGYWRRALALQRAAEILKEGFPRSPEELQKLPGIGPYTAGAVACFAFQHAGAFLDTNIRRVYLSFFFEGKKGVSDKEILPIAQKAIWKENPREWHYALFDYGAAVLKNTGLNKQSRHYAKQGVFEGSPRFFRTKVVRLLLENPKIKKETLEEFLRKEIRKYEQDYSPEEIISSLLKDGILRATPMGYRI